MKEKIWVLVALFVQSFCSWGQSHDSLIGRQLFVDSNNIESTNLGRHYHVPDYYHLNPVLKADKEWELNRDGDPYGAPFSGGVWYDETAGKFKMWYSAGGGKELGLVTCYAESKDGKHWAKPKLDIVPGTNIIDTSEHDCVSVLLDKFEKDATKRYKMFLVEFNNRRSVSMRLKYSADGIHWGNPVAMSGELYDRCAAYYDPFREEYVLSLKTLNGKYRRSRNYLSGKDPELLVSLAHRTFDLNTDKFIRYWFHADENDPKHPQFPEIRPQIYNHEAIAYEGLMLGYFTIWQGPENNVCDSLKIQKRNEVLIGWSRNGFDWNREDKSPFLAVSKDENAWNAGNVQSTNGNPLIVGDSLYFYVSGRYNNPVWDSNFSTGLATLRRDGFVSMHANEQECYLETRLLKIEKDNLFLNAEIKDQLVVEILDKEKNPIAGFTKSDCITTKELDSTRFRIKWKNNENLFQLRDQYCSIRFFVTNGDIYSYWLSDSETGESGGYTAGGGPGLNPNGTDSKF
ncbi:hypothetical protein [Mangrovibacterium marinum]|uniref:Glycosyl hydrolase family 32 n=2 Tax=Mangrovibacterium marinum TaxID=1639118 RepID=A0A2T5BZ67_9BACT|nr:hypothetical protein [Mangrovibacterium marinum]PTN07552.1 hypothetical protein C8N47_11677 [Mangrovibacterium marinum]